MGRSPANERPGAAATKVSTEFASSINFSGFRRQVVTHNGRPSGGHISLLYKNSRFNNVAERGKTHGNVAAYATEKRKLSHGRRLR